jgi:SRSO17 transposase
VPDDVKFETKPQIALGQIRAALAAGVAPGVVLADAAYGNNGKFRAGVTQAGLTYAVGVQASTNVWPTGVEPLPPGEWSGHGRKPSRPRRDADHAPVSAKALAMRLPADAWCEGSNAPLASRFAAIRVRPASRNHKGGEPAPHEWLLVEWPVGEVEPTKYWLSTLPEDTPLATLVDIAKLRWRIERDYEELKSELGLAHFEGRGWRGFHHHATLCIAAYGFLIRKRAALPPSGALWREKPRVPDRPPPEAPRSGPSVTSRTRSRPSDASSPSLSRNLSSVARVVSQS